MLHQHRKEAGKMEPPHDVSNAILRTETDHEARIVRFVFNLLFVFKLSFNIGQSSQRSGFSTLNNFAVGLASTLS